MTKGKIFTNLGFVTGGIAEEQLVEFEKTSSELREIFTKIRTAAKNKRKERYGIKNASSIRYGELK